MAVLRFEPPWGGLGATYDDLGSLVSNGKHVGDFLLVLLNFFH